MTDPAPYLEPDDLRDLPLLDNTTRFPDALLVSLVARFEALAERYRGRAYRVRTATVVVDGTTGTTLWLDYRDLVAVSDANVNGDTIDETAITVWADGRLVRTAGWGAADQQVSVTFTYGLTEPPECVLSACREFVRRKAIESKGDQPRGPIGDPNVATFGRPAADWWGRKPTGIPEVDDALNEAEDRPPGVVVA